MALAVTLGVAWGQITENRNLTDIAPETLELVADATEQAQDGARLFDYHCSACHGDTGLGLDEAKTSFPVGKRECTECHRETNPAQMEYELMRPNFAFSVGDPPALRGEGTLAKFSSARTLHAYIQATMPRPFPGQLPGDEVWAITAFLLHANGVDIGDEPLNDARDLGLPAAR